MNAPFSRQEEKDISIEEKLRALHELQSVVSEIDKIKTLRGELPLEVQDLEDEITGLKTRLKNLDEEIKNLDTAINNKKIAIKDSQVLITKYTEQQNNVRNNREFDSLSKEIEFQNLEIQLSEKRIKEFTTDMAEKKEAISISEKLLKERVDDLDRKKKELEEITEETKIEELQLDLDVALARSDELKLGTLKRLTLILASGFPTADDWQVLFPTGTGMLETLTVRTNMSRAAPTGRIQDLPHVPVIYLASSLCKKRPEREWLTTSKIFVIDPSDHPGAKKLPIGDYWIEMYDKGDQMPLTSHLYGRPKPYK